MDERGLIFSALRGLFHVDSPNKKIRPVAAAARVASFNGKCLGGFITSDTESMLRQLSEHIFLRTSCDVLERLPARARSIAAAVRHKRRNVAREQV